MPKGIRIAATLAAAFLALAQSAHAASATIYAGVNGKMKAVLMTPDGPGRHPAVLVLQTSAGVERQDFEYADRLVHEGYVALIPYYLDAYGISPLGRRKSFTKDAQPIYADLVACLDLLRKNDKVNGRNLGAVGFSNGGYFALWLAATGQVQAGISYYGAVTGDKSDNELNLFRRVFSAKSSPVLILHGDADSMVPVQKAIELDSILTASGASHEIHIYPGAEHRFDRSGGAANKTAANDAWTRSSEFLARNLKKQ